MYCSSRAFTRGCFSGARYNKNQQATQTNPIAPVSMNADFHPKCNVINVTISGATIAPTEEPELKIPVTYARSFFGNHSATVLIAAGKFAASPSPSTALAMENPATERTPACKDRKSVV